MYFIGFPISAFLYIVLFLIIYFSKKRISIFENKLLISIMLLNLVGLILELSCYWVVFSDNIDFFKIFILKSYVAYIALFNFSLSTYLLLLTDKGYGKANFNAPQKFKKYFWISAIPYAIIILLCYVLPINIYNQNGYYTYGPGVDILFVASAIQIFIWLVRSVASLCRKGEKNRQQYAILIAIILFGILGSVTQFVDKRILILTSLHSLVLVILYFFIENPDVKMLREIQQSKEFSEHANNEKAMFLYNTSQELKMPVKAIEEECEDLLNYELSDEMRERIRALKFAVKKLSSTISGTLDMPTTMATNIEIKVSKYSTKLLLKEMESISKLNMKDKNLEFRTSFDENIPEYLMGDSIRLKQIIATIMNNAIKHTEKGFIEFNVSSVIKHDICRLIITIEDSGAGIESSKLETLFYNAQDEDTVDEEKLTKVNDTRESLSVVKILTNLIGGTVIVNSELGKGSKFTVVLDQQIVEEKTSTDIAIEKLSSNKRILIVDDEEESLKQIAKLLNKYDVNVDAVLWGQDCLEKIRKKQKYDLILLDEDMPRLNGIKTFEKLKLEDDFNIPVVIMIDDKHLEYKERYLYNGFSSCVVKPLKKQELDKVIKKHLKIDE